MNTEASRGIKKRTILIIVLIVLYFVGLMFETYRYVDRKITDIHKNSISEIMEHDLRYFSKEVATRWNITEDIVRDLSRGNYETMDQLLDSLSEHIIYLDCAKLVLVDTEGRFYCSDGTMFENEALFGTLFFPGERFISRYEDTRRQLGIQVKDYLMFGAPVARFQVEDHKIAYALAV